MFVDQTSLLLALGFAAFALSATLFVTWLAARTERFILIWAVGAGTLMAAFAGFSINAVSNNYVLLWGSNMLLTGGFVVLFSAACLFTERKLPRARIVAVATASAALVTIPFLLGFDALGAIMGNLVNAALLIGTAWEFWRGRTEAPLWVNGIAALYGVTALSFIPCAIMIYLKGPLVLQAPPSGWAEDLNSIMGLVGVTGIGALSLALNQARIARQHRDEANTDPLTGLLNRRAVFERFGATSLGKDTAVLIFDLDHFKSINDKHGHAAGDEALRRFASVLSQRVPPRSAAARIGGEEFLLVVTDTDRDLALAIAEAVRSDFACEILQGPQGGFRGTVSAGLSTGEHHLDTFDNILRRADDALYKAKNSGRNRVSSAAAGGR
ncbi:diguanylate cyclase [Devosia sp. D6-9]|nr:diguanylate cyclase [Devosia sp. D6-9]